MTNFRNLITSNLSRTAVQKFDTTHKNNLSTRFNDRFMEYSLTTYRKRALNGEQPGGSLNYLVTMLKYAFY